ncbi:MAG: hypothetical protein R3E98_18015 [Gemmatimonadota bacterium]
MGSIADLASSPRSALAAALLVLAGASGADEVPSFRSSATPDTATSIELAFATHLDMDLPEQDVYLERAPGSGEVFRVTKGDHDLAAPLYKAARPAPHDPFNPDAVGPLPKGAPLGLTLGEWLRHQGSGRYTCQEGEGTLDLRFSGLVPNGVYTLWHAFIAIPPPVPFTGTLDLPLGARDGSESAFRADADGSASFHHRFRPCLQMSDVWTTSMIAVNYHSDGRTWGGHPGQFGYNAHIPLFVMLPNRDGIG